MQVYFAGDLPILVDEGRGKFFPTAMGLWAAPDALPFLVVHSPVSKFVCGGADLMLPGVCAISHESLKEGSLAAVKVTGNPIPFAVGVVLFDPGKATVSEGRVLQLLQTYCDGLWEASGDARPNAGFKQDQVFAIEDAHADQGGGGAGKAAAEGEGVAGDKNDDEKDGEEDRVDDEEGGGGSVGTPEEMSVLLEECFLQAVRTRVKDKDLPMDVSVFYLQHMRAVRPASKQLEVKRSSFKKLSKFIAYLICEGLIKVSAATKAAPERITSIVRAHPKVREFEPMPPELTFEAQQQLEKEKAGTLETKSKNAAFQPILVDELFRPHESMYGVLFPADRQAYYTMEECKQALESYIRGEHASNAHCLVDALQPSRFSI